MVAELLGGELLTSARPAAPHARVATRLGVDLGGRFDGPLGGWWFLDEPELHLGEDVLVPDLAAWRIERMPEVPDVAAFTLPPDWLCEVLSPATATIDRTRKLPIYAGEGVSHLWLIDPLARTLEVLRLDAGRWIAAAVHGGSMAVRAEPFAAIALEPGRWWLTPPAPGAR
ncbi:MAG: Uma2 family endonuclease [bacterium]|nr:Uma2 family endonuclease [bacterium]